MTVDGQQGLSLGFYMHQASMHAMHNPAMLDLKADTPHTTS